MTSTKVLRCAAAAPLWLALLLTGATTATAGDFVFKVPIELHHINADAPKWFLRIAVCDANWADGANITSMIVAECGATIDVVNGEYSGVVTADCVRKNNRNPADGAVYVVDMAFKIAEYPYSMLGNHATGKYACDSSKPCNVHFARQMPNYTGFTRAPK